MTALTHLSRRGVVRVGGPDAATLLNGVITIDVAKLAPGEHAPAALLTPQGKILCELHAHVDAAGAIFLDAPADAVADLVKRLALYRLRAKAEIDDVSADHAVLAGPGGARRLGDATDATMDLAAYDLMRVTDGRAEQGPDYGPADVFPADVNLDLLGGVDYAKGCFVGQEVVSRMKRRGSIRKRTLVLEADGAAPENGAAITAGDVRIGETLSAAGSRALALVRLDRLADADPDAIRCADAPAKLVFPDWFPADARRVAKEAS